MLAFRFASALKQAGKSDLGTSSPPTLSYTSLEYTRLRLFRYLMCVIFRPARDPHTFAHPRKPHPPPSPAGARASRSRPGHSIPRFSLESVCGFARRHGRTEHGRQRAESRAWSRGTGGPLARQIRVLFIHAVDRRENACMCRLQPLRYALGLVLNGCVHWRSLKCAQRHRRLCSVAETSA